MTRIRPVVDVVCHVCAGEFSRRKQDVAASIRSQGFWQCQACSNKATCLALAAPVGSVRSHRQTGYVEEKTERGWVRQHIVVMERWIGRRLQPNEVVHHKNEVKTDNDLNNLELMDRGAHTVIHHSGATRTAVQRNNISQGRRIAGRQSTHQLKEIQ